MVKKNVGRKDRTGKGPNVRTSSKKNERTNDHIVQITSIEPVIPAMQSPAWPGLQKELGDQIQDIIGAQRRRAMDIGQKIAMLSADLAPMNGPVGPSQNKIAEITRAWERYQPEMNAHLQSLINVGNGTFDNFNRRWTELSSSMQKAVVQLGYAKDLPSAQEEVVDAWLELSVEISALFTKGMDSQSTEFKRLQETWSSLMKDMNRFSLDLRGQDPGVSDTLERMKNFSEETNKELLKYWTDSYGQFQRLQKIWTSRMSDAGMGIMNAMLDTNMRILEENTKRNDHKEAHREI